MVRKIREILEDAYAAKDVQTLIDLWNEIANNKKNYPLDHIWYANLRIRELVLKSDGDDLQKGKFYMHLITGQV